MAAGIDIRHLRYFLAVYDELHFGHAAERLHIAQPPLSHAIRKLERELGTELLERTSRTVRPTAAGRVFAEEARRVVTSLEFAIAEARRVGQIDPPIRVGCGFHVSSRWLQRFLAALQQRDGNVRAEVTHLLGLQQVERLRAGALDLGVFTYAEDHEGLAWAPLFPGESLSAFLPASSPLASKSALTPGDLRAETLLTSSRDVNPVFWDSLMATLEGAGFRFGDIHEMNPDPRDVFLAVANGLGVALGPSSFEPMSHVMAGELVGIPLDPAVSYPDTIVAWRADPPRQLSGLLDAVREAASELFASPSPQPTS